MEAEKSNTPGSETQKQETDDNKEKTGDSNPPTPQKPQDDAQTDNAGRTGKQARLKEVANDPKASSADRGWIKNEQRQVKNGNRDTIRNPPGKDLAHERGREAAKGYSYKHSNLQDRDLHRTQHKYDDQGRANKERPVTE
ncbi:MAG: polymorphic toxin type 8 domain-containing protein [Methylacidiphilales bacterium]|nr:polymorphic toxin type 8 domain-containing protein [Candidatus Methylacidiphilales bacterium]